MFVRVYFHACVCMCTCVYVCVCVLMICVALSYLLKYLTDVTERTTVVLSWGARQSH